MVAVESLELYLTSIYVFLISYILGLFLIQLEDWTDGHGIRYINLNFEFALYLALIATGAYIGFSQYDLHV